MHHRIPLLILALLLACDSTVKGQVTVETNTDPTVEITAPANGAVSPIFTTVTCTGRVYDEIETLSTDEYVWLLDETEIASGMVAPNGEVSASFTLTDYDRHVLQLQVSDQNGISDADFVIVDAGGEPDTDGDGVVDSDDCNPTNSELYQTGSWYPDEDRDGYGSTVGFQSCGPWDGYVTDPSLATDCNDERADTHPGAREVCNHRDDDCDGTSDSGAVDAETWYIDQDVDGWGSDATVKVECDQPRGYVASRGDCDDGDTAVHPGVAEVCGGDRDLDCDGNIGATTWYADRDGDGYGDPAVASTDHSCDAPSGSWVNNSGDCDGDADPNVNSGTLEVCDHRDNDCDTLVDDSDPSVGNQTVWSYDYDLDGYGDPGLQATQCDAPAGYVGDDQDCDDGNPQTFPGGLEYCDLDDNDCDGVVDNDALDASVWYLDADGDGFGDASTTLLSCSQPAGYSATSDDCDDHASGINPGTVWYADRDGDGYGDATNTSVACQQPAGFVADSSDCADGEVKIHPNAAENCDAVDQDCDGSVDEEVPDDGYEMPGRTAYNLMGNSATGWFSSTDTVGEDWYTFTVSVASTAKSPKTVNISYSGPSGHVVTVEVNDGTAITSTLLTSASPIQKTVVKGGTSSFSIQITADTTLSDSDLCLIPYTLRIY